MYLTCIKLGNACNHKNTGKEKGKGKGKGKPLKFIFHAAA